MTQTIKLIILIRTWRSFFVCVWSFFANAQFIISILYFYNVPNCLVSIALIQKLVRKSSIENQQCILRKKNMLNGTRKLSKLAIINVLLEFCALL